MSVDAESYIIPESTRIDAQTGFKCSAFSSAYVLRHWGIEAHGDSVYEVMPDKMEGGYVYPKEIVSFLESNGFDVEYHIGNLNALKDEVAEGHPVIVMIKIYPEQDWLHYVPVVGYTPDSIFIAESLPELCRKLRRDLFQVGFQRLFPRVEFPAAGVGIVKGAALLQHLHNF